MAESHACHTNDIIGMASAIPAHYVPAPLKGGTLPSEIMKFICQSLVMSVD